MRLPRDAFERLVAHALDDVPAEFREKLENVEIVVEDSPSPEDLGGREVAPGTLVLGLYRGVPLTRRSVFATNLFPDQIIIFQRPIERICRTPEEIVEQVRRTVLHEIAHHFGISEKRLRELGY
jgi:predicted Zn-dependent protease with MMP-like domain